MHMVNHGLPEPCLAILDQGHDPAGEVIARREAVVATTVTGRPARPSHACRQQRSTHMPTAQG